MVDGVFWLVVGKDALCESSGSLVGVSRGSEYWARSSGVRYGRGVLEGDMVNACNYSRGRKLDVIKVSER